MKGKIIHKLKREVGTFNKVLWQLCFLMFLFSSVTYAQSQYAVNNGGADDENLCSSAWPAEILGNYIQNGTNNGKACYEGPNGYWLYHANMYAVGESWVVGYPLGSTNINGDNIRFYYPSTSSTPPTNVDFTRTRNGCGKMYVTYGGAAPPVAPTLYNPSNVGATSMNLSWSQSSGTTEYHVYVSTNSSFTALVSGLNPKTVTGNPYPATSTSISGLNRGTKYYIRVRAYSGAGESSNSNTVNATTAPDAPTATNASSILDQSFQANWNAASGATGYTLYVSTNSSFSSHISGYNGKSVGNVTSYNVSGLSSNTTYYYRLKASNSSGTSGYSNSKSLTTVCSAPVSSAATSVTQSSFNANWSASGSATGYYLDVATNSSFSSKVTGYDNKDVGNVTTYNVTGLNSGTTYYYRVRSYNSNGSSGNSSTQSLTTLPSTPVATSSTMVHQTSFTSNWNSTTGATGYRLDVATDNGFTNFVTGYNNLDVSNVTTYSVNSNLSANTTYYYRVRAYNGTGTSGNSNTVNLTTAPSPPTTQAGSILFSNVGTTKMKIDWTTGNGINRVVFVKQGNSGTASPGDYTTYSSSANFGSGTQIGTTGWYCVYNGNGSSVTVSNLMPGSTYRVMVCEYNGSGGLETYDSDTATDNPSNQTTKTIMINELDANTVSTDDKEFIELFDGGTGNVALDGLVLVLFNGNGDVSYRAMDLNGETTDANGYFLIGNSGVTGVDVTFPNNTLQNGADAAALYGGSDGDFPSGTAVTTSNLVDALVYDNDDADDASLLVLLNGGEPQVNENSRADSENHSLQRIPNGSGGLRNTSSYVADWPTPKAENVTSPEINIKGNGNTIADGDTTPTSTDDTDFGNVDVGSNSTNTFTIENSGLASLTISGLSPYVTLSGDNPDQFSISSAPSNSIGIGSTTTFDIKFSPTSAGAKTAIVTINNDDDNEGTYNFQIGGTGIVPEINVKQNVTNIADGTGSFDFGDKNVGTDTDITFTVENSGAGSLTVGNISLGGTNADQFSVEEQPGSPVAGSGSTTFKIRFSPTSYGDKTATISFANNDGDENPYNFTITGTGFAPEIVVKDGANNIADGTGSYDFGSKNVGTNTDVTLTIENIGNSNLTLGTVTLGGTNADQFSIQSEPTSPVSGSGSTSLKLRFTPTTYGAKTATVSFTTNDSDENPFNFTINGTGLEPEIVVKEGTNNIADGTGSYDFGNKDVGTNTDVTFTIENIGNINLTLGTVTLGGTNADQFSVQAEPTSPVTGSGSTSFKIRFTPTTYGAKTATVSFTNNDADESPFNFTINGTGVECEINVKQGTTAIADGTASYGFGDKNVGTNTDASFTIENIGNSNLTLGTATLSGDDADQFSIETQPSSPVTEGNNTTLTVRFSPTTYGDKTATVSFPNNDANENPFDFTVTGTGLAPEINIKESTNDIADGTGTYDFGSKLVGDSKETTFTVENIGNSNLTLGNVTLGGANADQFSVQLQPTTPVSGSGSTTFKIKYAPTSVGAKTATVGLSNNDGDENPYNFSITGSATSPEINLKEGVNNIADGGTYNFGDKKRNTDTDVVFTIENLGSSALNLSGTPVITIAGTNANQFSVQVQPSTPIAVSNSTTFTIRYSPTELGAKTASISIANDDLDENPYNLNLAGTGINNPPVLANIEGTALEYIEGTGAVRITNTTTTADADNNNISGGVVQISNNYQPSEDVLEFTNTATITGTWNSGNGKMTLVGQDTKANYQTALNSVKYKNTSSDPITDIKTNEPNKAARSINATPRTISFTINDGIDNSNIETRNINVVAQNNPPELELNTGITIDEGSSKIIDNTMLKVVDPDNDEISTRYYVTEGPAHGRLVIGSSANFKINNENEINTIAFRQNEINQGKVEYQHDGGEETSDSFKFYLEDNDGGTSQEFTFSITVNTLNDIPVLSNIEDTPIDYIVNDTPVNVTSTIEIDDPDNPSLVEANIQIENYYKDADFLSFQNTDLITHTFDVETGTLTLTGDANLAAYQDALRSVEFFCIGGIPGLGVSRTVKFTVSDGTDLSNEATRDIDVFLPAVEDPQLVPPSKVAVELLSDKTIMVSWQDNSDSELGFLIYRVITVTQNKEKSILSYVLIGIVEENVEEFIDEDVEEGIAYQYKVEAFNDDGYSPSTDNEGQLIETIIPPSDLTLNNTSGDQVVLNWIDNSETETKYIIERDDGNGYAEIAQVDADITTYTDNNLSNGWHYYRVKAQNINSESSYSNIAEIFTGPMEVNQFGDEIPDDFTICQNYPNPFNPATTIRYGIPESANVKVTVYNILGQKILTLVDMMHSAGYYEVSFDGASVNSGIYFYKIEAGDFIQIKKMILLK